MKNPVVSILGMGALGTAIAADLTRNGYDIQHLIVKENIEDVSELLRYKAVRFDDLNELKTDILFITVRDDQLKEVVALLSHFNTLECKLFVHCSGALTSDILKPLLAKGSLAAYHPMKSFVKGQGNTSFGGVYVDIETENDGDYEILRHLAESQGAIPFRVNKESKINLHTAASMVSNFGVALADVSSKLVDINDSKIADSALFNLMYQTIGNVTAIGTIDALSGPILRGDSTIIRQHLDSISSDANVLRIYISLAKHTLKMVEDSERLSKERIDAMNAILKEYE